MKKLYVFLKSLLLKTIEMLAVLLLIMFSNQGFSQTASNESGWYLTNYSFKDGSLQKETVLMGTTSRMKDVISFKGDKGNIEIMQNRYAVPDGKLIAGVTYEVTWSNPPEILIPGEKYSIDFELKTISSKTWKAPQHSMHFNQSPYSVYFVTQDGTKYITKDINSELTTDKVINKGTKGAKRFIQMNFGNSFVATYNYEWRDGGAPEKTIVNENNSSIGWHLTNYSFKDGSLQKESVLMGTTSKMKDVISCKGNKGNIEITQNRFDVKTGKLLAGITYGVFWTDPPTVLNPNEKSSLDFELNTISSLTWKVPQQSMYINQGLNGVYFITPEGTKYITKDIKTKLTTEKVIDKGTKGAKRFIQMNFGNGFVATYNYEWREF
ncbi:MAG TPA: hypothetical protein VLM44_08130 [Lutibacter sp.]|nr:hypothetical protein [Lutibacter sp.]